MNKRDKEKAQENLPNHLRGHRVIGKSLLHFCCYQAMLKVEEGTRFYMGKTLYYCPKCHHEESSYLKQMRLIPDTFS